MSVFFPDLVFLGTFGIPSSRSRTDLAETDERGMGNHDGFEETREGDWLRFQRRTTGRKIFGGILFLLNAGVIYLFFAGKFHNPDGQVASAWAALVPGLFLGLPSLGLLLFRSGIGVNTKEMRVRHWWGFPRPWRIREESLSSFSHVEVLKEVRRSGNNTVIRYPIRLVGGEKPFNLTMAGEPLSARRLSERFAAAMAKPLHNHLSGIPVIRMPEEFDRSLGENIVASGELPELPSQPEGSKLGLQVDGERLQVEIPAPGLIRGGLALMVMALPALALAIGFTFMFGGRQPLGFRLFMVGMVAVPMAGAFFYALSRGVREELLEVGPEEIRVLSRYPWMESSASIPTREVEEITQTEWNKTGSPLAGMLAFGGVTLMSDEKMLTFGTSLSHEDRSFVIELVRYVLARRVAKAGGGAKEGAKAPTPDPKVEHQLV